MKPQERKATASPMLWAIDPTHTTVEFAVKNLFFFTVKGSLDVREGSIVLDPDDVSRSSTTAVLRSTSINTGNRSRDEHLRAADYLDADRYPEIRFQSTKVERGTDRDTLRVTGSLTVKEISKEIVLDVSEIDRSRSPNGQYVAYYTALTNIDRVDLGVAALRALIGRKLKIMINVQATRPT